MSKLMAICFAGLLLFFVCFTARGADQAESDSQAVELFNARIMPIFRSSEPSSCIQCHLASVDLKEYILPSHEKTFVSLRDQGLIDLDSPEDSKILTLIRMGEKDLDEGARLIHEQTRKAEYDAFAAWIKACCGDPMLRNLPPLASSERARPDKSDPVIRHSRKSRVVDSFARNVWSQRMRCFPCHTPYEIDETDARQQAAVKTLQKLHDEYPDLVERLNIFRRTPEETLAYLIDNSRQTEGDQWPLLNLDDPRQSLLVLKPMSKLPAKGQDGEFAAPSSAPPVSHMGGLKMHPNDQTYKAFVSWIRDYANVVGGQYASVEDLPADNWVATDLVVRLEDAPADWPVATTVQLFVHNWNEQQQSWSENPIAFTQGTITPRRIVNGALFLLREETPHKTAASGAEVGSLPRGRYLVKTCVDRDHRLEEDPSLLLGIEDFVGQAEIPKARWREGFRFAESISGKQLSVE